MNRLFTAMAMLGLFLGLLIQPAEAATFYGEIKKGYQLVERKQSGYAVYVPFSFDSDKQAPLIFVFGRSQKDLALTREQLTTYLQQWAEEAEKRGMVVVAPYWEPVIVESGKHTEKFFLEILEEAKMMYNAQQVLVAGFGLGTVMAFSMAAYYPNQFAAVATIAGSPLRDKATRNMMLERLISGLPPKKLPPVLLIHGEDDGVIPLAWVEEDKAFLEEKGNRLDLQLVPHMGHEQPVETPTLILDWFETVRARA